jgi:hypothetical protein
LRRKTSRGNPSHNSVDAGRDGEDGGRAYPYLSFGEGPAWIANVDSKTKAVDEQPLEVVLDRAKSHAFDPKTEVAIY